MIKWSGVIESQIDWATTDREEFIASVGCCPVDLNSNHHTSLCHMSCDVASICAVTNLITYWIYRVLLCSTCILFLLSVQILRIIVVNYNFGGKNISFFRLIKHL